MKMGVTPDMVEVNTRSIEADVDDLDSELGKFIDGLTAGNPGPAGTGAGAAASASNARTREGTATVDMSSGRVETEGKSEGTAIADVESMLTPQGWNLKNSDGNVVNKLDIADAGKLVLYAPTGEQFPLSYAIKAGLVDRAAAANGVIEPNADAVKAMELAKEQREQAAKDAIAVKFDKTTQVNGNALDQMAKKGGGDLTAVVRDFLSGKVDEDYIQGWAKSVDTDPEDLRAVMGSFLSGVHDTVMNRAVEHGVPFKALYGDEEITGGKGLSDWNPEKFRTALTEIVFFNSFESFDRYMESFRASTQYQQALTAPANPGDGVRTREPQDRAFRGGELEVWDDASQNWLSVQAARKQGIDV